MNQPTDPALVLEWHRQAANDWLDRQIGPTTQDEAHELAGVIAAYDPLMAERDALKGWVDDLQSGMFINCVYCGHRYGPQDEVSATRQQMLYDHIKICPKHPLSTALTKIAALKQQLLGANIELAELRRANEIRTKSQQQLMEENERLRRVVRGAMAIQEKYAPHSFEEREERLVWHDIARAALKEEA